MVSKRWPSLSRVLSRNNAFTALPANRGTMCDRRLESTAKVGEEIGAAQSSGDPRFSWQVETDMGVGNEEFAY